MVRMEEAMCTETSLADRPSSSRGARRKEEHIDVEILYAQYLNAVLAYVLSRVPNRSEAEDITSETFLAALVALPRFRGQCSPYAWLLGIARQKIAEAARRRDRRRELLHAELTEEEQETLGLLSASSGGALPEEVVLHAEARKTMRGFLDCLPEVQREVLILQSAHDLTIREIAHVIGRSVAATNSLLERARMALFRLGQSYFAG
jgi:RNA polymerase sigma-70 factor, ECF subfamily